MSLRSAMDADSELVADRDAEGRICAEFISCYPPGIPIVIPGERLTGACMAAIARASESCPNLQREDPVAVRVVKEPKQ